MACNCKKNSSTQSSMKVTTPKGRGVNSGKRIVNVKRTMRRNFK